MDLLRSPLSITTPGLVHPKFIGFVVELESRVAAASIVYVWLPRRPVRQAGIECVAMLGDVVGPV
jgi:hypothetical protein